MAGGNLRVVELEFDQIKENLKNFLRNQKYFTDFDFEGSGMSIMLDLLAYDTHYKAYLANMAINERFIDTSVKRASVVSHAKQLGYVPRSAKSAMALVNITVYGVRVDYTMSIDKYTPFSASIGGTTYTFVTTKSYTTTPSGEYNAYTFNNVELYEGNPIEYTYIATGTKSEHFKIPAFAVDTSTLVVNVQTSATDTTTKTYQYADAVSLLKPTDLVYFIEEGVDGYFYVYFGDGILGKQLDNNNIVRLQYLVSSGDAPNVGANFPMQFTLNGTIGGYGNNVTQITTVNGATGGGPKQNTEEIRALANKNYAAQGRAVTTEDFKALLLRSFPEIDSIVIWGGEDNVPPIYGRVFISVKPKTGYLLSDATKDKITKFLREKSIVSIQADFVDPEFTFISVMSSVKFDRNLTTKDSNQIAALAKQVIIEYFKSSLQKFNKHLYISRLQAAIDKIDPSVLGNSLSVRLQKRFEPILALNSSYYLYFNNKILPYSVFSSSFKVIEGNSYTTVAIKDVPDTTPPNKEGTGTLVLYDVSDGRVINPAQGTVNYGAGKVSVESLTVMGYPDLALYDVRVSCETQEQIDEISNAIVGTLSQNAYIPVPMQNQILMLDDSVAYPQYGIAEGLSVTAAPV